MWVTHHSLPSRWQSDLFQITVLIILRLQQMKYFLIIFPLSVSALADSKSLWLWTTAGGREYRFENRETSKQNRMARMSAMAGEAHRGHLNLPNPRTILACQGNSLTYLTVILKFLFRKGWQSSHLLTAAMIQVMHYWIFLLPKPCSPAGRESCILGWQFSDRLKDGSVKEAGGKSLGSHPMVSGSLTMFSAKQVKENPKPAQKS